MFPAKFDYVVADSFEHASEQLTRAGDGAKLLAGGCSLIPLMKLRLAEPRILIDLTRIEGAGVITEVDGAVEIGALTRESDIEASPILRDRYPILADTSGVIGDPLVRNMGTVGGNLAHADPANDHPATMLALGAELVIRGPAGSRTVPIDGFFVDLFETGLGAGEVLTAIRLRRPAPATGSAYVKLERQVGDFPVVAAAAVIVLRDGVVREASICLTNVGPTPVRATTAEATLTGERPTDAAVLAAAARAVDGLEPWSELRGSAAYKLRVLPAIVRRALLAARARAVASDVAAAV